MTKHYSLVGTAFDYLMRFYVENLNPRAVTGPWVAEHAVDRMKELGIASFQGSILKISSDLLHKGEEIISKGGTVYLDYPESGVVNDELIGSVLELAQLDTYFRPGIIDENFGGIDLGYLNLVTILSANLSTCGIRASTGHTEAPKNQPGPVYPIAVLLLENYRH